MHLSGRAAGGKAPRVSAWLVSISHTHRLAIAQALVEYGSAGDARPDG